MRSSRHSYELINPTTIVIGGIIVILIGPIAEEIFWRGYFLEQLRKITYSSVALLIQAVLFAFSHRWLLDQGMLFLLAPFWYGVITGLWRIRFRSIVPLIIVHVILNAVVLFPMLKIRFDEAANLWSKPHARQIDALTIEPIPIAVPKIISFLSDPDQDVSNYSVLQLTTRYKHDSEPYLKEALASKDPGLVKGVLFVVGLSELSSLEQEVREVAWSPSDQSVQLAATLTLYDLRDAEGLQDLAKRHENEKVRSAAEYMVTEMQKNQPGGTP